MHRQVAIEEADDPLENVVNSLLLGTAAENNRYLRRQIMDARKKRDAYMNAHMNVMAPFLLPKVLLLLVLQSPNK